jgi:hypothetical protein
MLLDILNILQSSLQEQFLTLGIGKCRLVQGKVYKVGDHTTICQKVLHYSGRMCRDVWKYPDQCNIYLRRITTYFGRKLRCYIDREK